MNRLQELRELRDLLNVEIRREERAEKRLEDARRRAHAALTRGSWNCRVVAATCLHFGITSDQLLHGGRERALVQARFVAMWLMRDADRPLSEIADELGFSHHTTVLHGVRRVERDPALLTTALEIRAVLTTKEAS